MKWYLHTHHNILLAQIKEQRESPLKEYYPWVIQIANTFPRDGVAIGALNLQDLIQAGYVSLIEAWNLCDHSRPQPEKWAYIKKRIKWGIRREIDNYGAFIKVSRRRIEDHRKKLTGVDKILVDTFPQFFDEELSFTDDAITDWDNEQLSMLIEDHLRDNYKTYHVNILMDSYGIDTDKPVGMKELAIKNRTTANYINQVKMRLIKQLKNDEEFKLKINKFYEI